MWSAAVDPRVLTVRFVKPAGVGARLFDPRSAIIRKAHGPRGEHLLVDHGGEIIRLDVVEGSSIAGPVTLQFDLADDDRFDGQLAAMSALRAAVPAAGRHVRLARRLLPLHALDAREAGASLREIANLLFGPGEWPGDGEHRKSRVRRLLDTGDGMVRDGPRQILNML
jgi:hypothetical protein